MLRQCDLGQVSMHLCPHMSCTKIIDLLYWTALLEEHMHKVSPSRLEALIRIFVRATELEIRFWDMGLSDKKLSWNASILEVA